MFKRLKQWLALCHTPGIGARKLLSIVERNLNPASFLQNPAWEKVEADLAWLDAAANNHLIPLYSPQYPKLLREIYDPPPLLYAKGQIDTLKTPQLAIVGSRKFTPSGRQLAYEYSRDLASAGLTVTSGLAIGIDTACHLGALEGGRTIAVLGSGLGNIYPARNGALAARLAENGCLLSELPPNAPPLPHHFPSRNRIISGLSQGVLVVEAAIGSGSLITARCALEQNREVYALPGNPRHTQSRGCHVLIKQGAMLVDSVDDILVDLNINTLLNSQNVLQCVHFCSRKRSVFQAITNDVTSLDEVVAHSGLNQSDASGFLLELEADDYIQCVPGGYMKLAKDNDNNI